MHPHDERVLPHVRVVIRANSGWGKPKRLVQALRSVIGHSHLKSRIIKPEAHRLVEQRGNKLTPDSLSLQFRINSDVGAF